MLTTIEGAKTSQVNRLRYVRSLFYNGIVNRPIAITHPPSRPSHLRPLDYLFRALLILSPLIVSLLVADLWAHPNAPGVAGQSFLLRILFGLFIGPALLLLGAVLLWRAASVQVGMGRFFIVLGLFMVGGQFSYELATPQLSGLAFTLFMIGAAGIAGPSLAYFMFTFPTGQIYPTRLAIWVKILMLVKFVGALLEVTSSSTRIKIFTLPANPLFIAALAPYRPLIAATIGITGLLVPFMLLAGMVSLWHRYQVSSVQERQQIKWVAWAFAILILTILMVQVLLFANGDVNGLRLNIALVFIAIAELLFLAAVAVAILRYHLFDIDLLINRTLVYGLLTAIVVGLYALVVGYLSELFHDSAHFAVSLLATGLIAVLFQPLRERLQLGVNRLLYGERDDPYGVLARLGERLETTVAPATVLPVVVETVAQALKLPYAAVALKQSTGTDELDIVAAYGRPAATMLHLPLVYQGETIGQLMVAGRTPGESFTASERRLLETIARQTSVAAHAVRLMADLQQSRERLVTAREEERRRLRRDLHDGLGPALAGLLLKVDTIHDRVADDETADALLLELKRHIQEAIAEIRRLVYNLRPPALDEFGLVGAIQEYLLQGNWPPTLAVSLDVPEKMPQLPAAVEVAAYRIIQEALTNVVRHAQAQCCTVRLCLPNRDRLELEISDDGLGLPAGWRAGVGVTAMRERVSELGGTYTIADNGAKGTIVNASLPLNLVSQEVISDA
jgi:signal transduction histidine kinase